MPTGSAHAMQRTYWRCSTAPRRHRSTRRGNSRLAFRYNAREQGHCTLPAASSHLHAVHVRFVRTGVQLLYNMWHSGINATSVDRSELNYFNAQLPLRCAMVMKVVHAQLYNACQWYRMTSTWTRTTPRDGEGGTGNGVPPAWKGFVPFKASAQDVTCYTDFFDRVAYAAEWSTRYSVSEAERSPGSRAGSSPVASRTIRPLPGFVH